MRKLAPALAVCLCLSACGTHPPRVPDLSKPAAPGGYTTYAAPNGDVSFSHPVTWAATPRTPPGVATVASGGASVTVWSYTATTPVLDAAAARQAMARLLASLKKRDPAFEVAGASVVPGLGGPAVQIAGRTKIQGRPVRVRSVHIWKAAGEYVIDGLADPAAFAEANKIAFEPLLKSLKVGGRR